MVGGAGLGFGGGAAAAGSSKGSYSTLPARTATGHTTFQELPGFSKAQGVDRPQDDDPQLPLPPPPPLPTPAPAPIDTASILAEAMAAARAAAARAAAAAAEAKGTLPPPPPLPAGGLQAAHAMSTPSEQQGHAEGGQQDDGSTAAAARAAMASQQDSGREYVKNFHENRFRSSFVSSGIAGGRHGDGWWKCGMMPTCARMIASVSIAFLLCVNSLGYY